MPVSVRCVPNSDRKHLSFWLETKSKKKKYKKLTYFQLNAENARFDSFNVFFYYSLFTHSEHPGNRRVHTPIFVRETHWTTGTGRPVRPRDVRIARPMKAGPVFRGIGLRVVWKNNITTITTNYVRLRSADRNVGTCFYPLNSRREKFL